MKFNKKKKFKGMTLIEIIVSLAVVAALTLVLVGTSSIINSYLRSATHVDRRVANQAPIAEAGDKLMAGQDATVPGGVQIKIGNVELSGNLYSLDLGGSDNGTIQYGSKLKMKFVSDIETTEAAATP